MTPASRPDTQPDEIGRAAGAARPVAAGKAVGKVGPSIVEAGPSIAETAPSSAETAPSSAETAAPCAETAQSRLDDAHAGLAIASAGLTKRFGSQLAVDGIDLAVPHGSVYGFLGPNGSGKTTTIRMLLGLIQPSSGTQQLLGTAMPAGGNSVLPLVGSLVEGPAYYPQLSGRANLARCDAADRTADPRTADARIDAALERVGLTAAAGKRYRAYSLGMKQRLGIAAGLLRPRRLMILDEPTNGLDPQGTREVRTLIRAIAADGITVFVSSHLLAEVEQICTHVGVMRTGRLVFQGTLQELRDRGVARILVRTAETELASQVLAKLGLAGIQTTGTEVTAQLGSELPERICADLVHAGVPVAGLETPRPSLEDLFVELTGEGFNVSG